MCKICHPGLNYHQFCSSYIAGIVATKYQQCSLMSLSSTTFSFDFDLQHTAACIHNDWTQTVVANGESSLGLLAIPYFYTANRDTSHVCSTHPRCICWNSPVPLPCGLRFSVAGTDYTEQTIDSISCALPHPAATYFVRAAGQHGHGHGSAIATAAGRRPACRPGMAVWWSLRSMAKVHGKRTAA